MYQIRVLRTAFIEKVRRLGSSRHHDQRVTNYQEVFRAGQPGITEVLTGETVGVGDVTRDPPDGEAGCEGGGVGESQHQIFFTQPVAEIIQIGCTMLL